MSLCPNCSTPLPPGTTECENCTTQAFTAARTLQDTPNISGYDVIRRIGEGGMGTVFLADERALGRRVAIKLVSARLAADTQTHARFLREARSLATIEHANVVRVYAFGEVDGLPYLTMEFVDGQTLSDRIRQSGRLSVEESVRIMRQVLLALEAAWEKGIVHRDVKPSNILLDRRDQVHVADFGLAKPVQLADDPVLTQSGSVMGTPYYLSPEQAQGLPTDFRSDIYSCGILLYEMLTGERPFEGTTPFAIVAKHLHESMPSIRSKRSDVPTRVVRLMELMTEKRPERRPQSYAELIGMFDALLGITPSQPLMSTQTLTRTPGAWTNQLPSAVLAVVLLAAFAALLLWQIGPWGKRAADASGSGDQRMAVAVAPFYGPDEDSAKEGRMMAALIERSIAAKLGDANVRIAGIDQTKEPLRSHEAARALGEKLGASVVVWGEAFALKKETEIQPYFTFVPRKAEQRETAASSEGSVATSMTDSPRRRALGDAEGAIAHVAQQTSAVVRVQAEAPNQIELRKTSAEGVGEMVSFLAAVDAFYTRSDAGRALRFLDQAPRTAEALRLRGRAWNEVAHEEDRGFRGAIPEKAVRAWNGAATAFEQALAIDPGDVQTRADLAETYLLQGRFKNAADEYGKVAAAGKPYVTHYAVENGGLIYVREVYRAEWNGTGSLDDTGYLLATNPADGTVVRRYRMPGVIRSFRPQEGGFSVQYAADRTGTQIESTDFTKGRFDRPLTIGGNLLLRMRGMKSGRILAQNFEEEYSKMLDSQPSHPQFRLRKKPLAGIPQTLPELDAALRDAARRDPTQPWHPFLLGQVLWAEGRRAEAEAVWRDLLARDFGVVWSDYNWMVKVCQRLDQREWADRFFARARTERLRLSQPIQVTTLIDRLIDAPVARLHADQKKDPELAYSWFRRGREMTGPAEGDHYYAAAWASHFRRAGDLAKARFEGEYARRAAADPFNFAAQSTIVDYAADLFLTMWFAFTAGLALILRRAKNRAGDAAGSRSFSMSLFKSREWAIAAVAIIASVILTVGASLFAMNTTRTPLSWRWFGIALVVPIILLLISRIGTFKSLVAAVSRRERLLLLASFLVFIVAASNFIHVANSRVAFMRVPMGIADSFGHPAIVSDLEKLLASHDTPTLRYVTAVANQLGGNTERARQLYQQLPDDGRAHRAFEALGKGEKYLSFPTQQELYASYARPASWIVPSRSTMELVASLSAFTKAFMVMIYGAAAAGCLFFAFCLFTPPAGNGEGVRRATGRIRRLSTQTFFALVPGTFDLLRRSVARGLIMLALLGFSMMSIWTAVVTARVTHSPEGVGVGTWVIPGMNLGSAAPMPPDATALDLILAPPYARLFWGLSIAAIVALLVLHAMRIRQIIALDRGDAALGTPTLATPQPSA